MTFSEYLRLRGNDLLDQAGQHALLVILAVLMATVISVGSGMLTWIRPRLAGAATAIAAGLLTVPSFALLGLLIPVLGLGWAPSLTAITLYSLLPILRNTLVGLNEVDPAVVEAARGMGLGPARVLSVVQLPLAWPYILAGIRITTQMVVAIATVAAFVDGPGLGVPILDGLARLGAANAANEAIAGTVAVVLVALAFDLCYVLLKRLTTPRGLHV
ncbi:MAG: osmoprotectant transport system permease protein [Streptomyces sp.]|nr:osmoprotectant transport system permease protein [Streptomyces sp.]